MVVLTCICEVSYYSGIFKGEGGFVGRPFFVHESGDLELWYSASDAAWLFRWTEEKMKRQTEKLKEQGEEDITCLNDPFLIKSSSTDTYDVVTVADQVSPVSGFESRHAL